MISFFSDIPPKGKFKHIFKITPDVSIHKIYPWVKSKMLNIVIYNILFSFHVILLIYLQGIVIPKFQNVKFNVTVYV